MEKTLYIDDREAWRTWLEEYHTTIKEVWLIFYKKHTGKPCITYLDAVEEALCFGWIDSIIQKIDEERYARKFTPRSIGSKWSNLNIERFWKMVDQGRMTPEGMKKYRLSNKESEQHEETTNGEFSLSENLMKKFMSNHRAWENFNKLPPSHRRNYLGWIMSAKREETQIKRFSQAIELLSQNKKLGMK